MLKKLIKNAVTFQCREVIHIQITQFIHNLFNFLQKPLQTEAAFVFYNLLTIYMAPVGLDNENFRRDQTIQCRDVVRQAGCRV